MITGAHTILYSRDAEADRAFFRDVLQFPHVDAGRGWLIFALPPGEVAVHPAAAEAHEFYLMCADIDVVRERLTAAGTPCTPIAEERWGRLVHLTLPGGGRLGVYQPKHPLAHGPEEGMAAAGRS